MPPSGRTQAILDLIGDYLNDLLALGATCAVIAGYHVWLRILARRDTDAVLWRVAADARALWVDTIMANPADGILAVQTLRNSATAATFLASTAVLLMVGVLTLSGQAPELKQVWHALNLIGTLRQELWLGKLLCMLLVLFFAFFSFCNAIRIFNHVGYMINARQGDGAPSFPPDLVASELNTGGRHFSLGMRAYYYLIPLVCWLFGPLYMVAAALVLVLFFLPRIDVVRFRARPGAG